jgi:geranylgeranyl diphosphate synthase type II
MATAVQSFQLQHYLDERRAQVNRVLEELLPATGGGKPATIEEAMRYSLSAGGKRLRPILALAAAEAVGGKASAPLLAVAASLELIHTYSLIHDDLPAMDDDDVRRGRPTSHKVFGEALAILAGDGLLTLAFELLTRPDVAGAVPPSRLVRVIQEIATAAGYQGMVGGQLLDLQAEGSGVVDEAGLERIHRRKTGALIRASVRAGAMIGGAGAKALTALSRYGERIGLAFQIMDDILDVEGTAAELGKAVNNDRSKGKATYPALLGLEASKKKLADAIDQAVKSLAAFGAAADPLRAIAVYVASRRV